MKTPGGNDWRDATLRYLARADKLAKQRDDCLAMIDVIMNDTANRVVADCGIEPGQIWRHLVSNRLQRILAWHTAWYLKDDMPILRINVVTLWLREDFEPRKAGGRDGRRSIVPLRHFGFVYEDGVVSSDNRPVLKRVR